MESHFFSFVQYIDEKSYQIIIELLNIKKKINASLNVNVLNS